MGFEQSMDFPQKTTSMGRYPQIGSTQNSKKSAGSEEGEAFGVSTDSSPSSSSNRSQRESASSSTPCCCCCCCSKSEKFSILMIWVGMKLMLVACCCWCLIIGTEVMCVYIYIWMDHGWSEKVGLPSRNGGGWWRRGVVVDGFKIVKLLDELGRGIRKLIEKTRPTELEVCIWKSSQSRKRLNKETGWMELRRGSSRNTRTKWWVREENET